MYEISSATYRKKFLIRRTIMNNNKKIKSKNVMATLRNFIRRDIVAVSKMREDGKMDLRFPNGQTFRISVEEVQTA